eukprot:1175769-Prorocentrum_minimum.AAC.1
MWGACPCRALDEVRGVYGVPNTPRLPPGVILRARSPPGDPRQLSPLALGQLSPAQTCGRSMTKPIQRLPHLNITSQWGRACVVKSRTVAEMRCADTALGITCQPPPSPIRARPLSPD